MHEHKDTKNNKYTQACYLKRHKHNSTKCYPIMHKDIKREDTKNKYNQVC